MTVKYVIYMFVALFVSGLSQSRYKDSHMCIHSPFRASPAIHARLALCSVMTGKNLHPAIAYLAAAQAILDASVAVSTATQASLAAPSIASMSSKS